MKRTWKLTEAEKAAVVTRYTTGETATSIGKSFNVSPQAILDLLRRRDVTVRTKWNLGTKGITGRKRTGENRECIHCLESFYVNRSNIVRFDPKYCSRQCYFMARWGDTHREIRKCVTCEAEFSEQIATERVCCGAKCRSKHLSVIRRAEKSHFWRGGKTAPYVGIWKTQRRKALERDNYLCVTCGGNDRVQVHHINPYRYSKSHDLVNLKTLCRSCHSREEYAVNLLRQEQLDSARAQRFQHQKTN